MGTILYAVCLTSIVLMYGIYHKIKIEDSISKKSVAARNDVEGNSQILDKEENEDIKHALIEDKDWESLNYI